MDVQALCGCVVDRERPGLIRRCDEGQELHDALAAYTTHTMGYATARRAYAEHVIRAIKVVLTTDEEQPS